MEKSSEDMSKSFLVAKDDKPGVSITFCSLSSFLIEEGGILRMEELLGLLPFWIVSVYEGNFTIPELSFSPLSNIFVFGDELSFED